MPFSFHHKTARNDEKDEKRRRVMQSDDESAETTTGWPVLSDLSVSRIKGYRNQDTNKRPNEIHDFRIVSSISQMICKSNKGKITIREDDVESHSSEFSAKC